MPGPPSTIRCKICGKAFFEGSFPFHLRTCARLNYIEVTDPSDFILRDSSSASRAPFRHPNSGADVGKSRDGAPLFREHNDFESVRARGLDGYLTSPVD